MKLIYNIFNYLENKCYNIKMYGDKDQFFPEESELDDDHIKILESIHDLAEKIDVKKVEFRIFKNELEKSIIRFTHKDGESMSIKIIKEKKLYYFQIEQFISVNKEKRTQYSTSIMIRRNQKAIELYNKIITTIAERLDQTIIETIKSYTVDSIVQ